MDAWQRILFFTIVLGIFFGFQILVFVTFRKFLKKRKLSKKWLNIITITPFALFTLPSLISLIWRIKLTDFPHLVYNILIIPFFIFQGAVFFIGLYLFIGKIIKFPFSLTEFVLKRFEKTKAWLSGFKKKKPVAKFDNSRRKFITGSTALVSSYAFIGAGMGVLNRDNYEITEKEIKISNLPSALKGTTITLLCDIHSGPYMSEEMMKDYSDVVNDVGSDIILIPGDLTNSQTSEAEPFAKAFRDLKAKHGVYGTLGNHDYFSDPNYIAEVVDNESPVKLLRNDSLVLNINGSELCLLGMDDTRQSGAEYDPAIIEYMKKTVAGAKEKFSNYGTLPKVLVYHKPYFLKEMAKENFDLFVTGHTHGGQVVLAKFGDTNLSIAATVSPYVSGLFKEGNTHMYVSRGIGVVALPIRLNCPPEITKITLA